MPLTAAVGQPDNGGLPDHDLVGRDVCWPESTSQCRRCPSHAAAPAQPQCRRSLTFFTMVKEAFLLGWRIRISSAKFDTDGAVSFVARKANDLDLRVSAPDDDQRRVLSSTGRAAPCHRPRGSRGSRFAPNYLAGDHAWSAVPSASFSARPTAVVEDIDVAISCAALIAPVPSFWLGGLPGRQLAATYLSLRRSPASSQAAEAGAGRRQRAFVEA